MDKLILIASLIVLFFHSCLGALDKHDDIPHLKDSKLRHMKWGEFCDNPELADKYIISNCMTINNQNFYYATNPKNNGVTQYLFFDVEGNLQKTINLPNIKGKQSTLTRKANPDGNILIDVNSDIYVAVEGSEGSKKQIAYYSVIDLFDFNKSEVIDGVIFIMSEDFHNYAYKNPYLHAKEYDNIPQHIKNKYEAVGFVPIALEEPISTDNRIIEYIGYDLYIDGLKVPRDSLSNDSIHRKKVDLYQKYQAKLEEEYINAINDVIEKNRNDIYMYQYERYYGPDDPCFVINSHNIAFQKPREINMDDFPNYANKLPEHIGDTSYVKFENFDGSSGWSSIGGPLGSSSSINYYNIIHNTDTIQFKSSNKSFYLWDVVPENINKKTTIVLKNYYDHHYLFMEYDFNSN